MRRAAWLPYLAFPVIAYALSLAGVPTDLCWTAGLVGFVVTIWLTGRR